MNEANAKRLLFTIADVLEDIGVEFLLYCGTLLGAVRENRFIKTDRDIDLAMLLENFVPVAKEIRNRLIEKRIRTHVVDYRNKGLWDGGIYAINFKDYGENGQMIGLMKVQGKRAHPCCNRFRWMVHTARFFEELREIEFYGRTFKVPKDANGALTELYGDWQTPTTEFVYPCRKPESWQDMEIGR